MQLRTLEAFFKANVDLSLRLEYPSYRWWMYFFYSCDGEISLKLKPKFLQRLITIGLIINLNCTYYVHDIHIFPFEVGNKKPLYTFYSVGKNASCKFEKLCFVDCVPLTHSTIYLIVLTMVKSIKFEHTYSPTH